MLNRTDRVLTVRSRESTEPASAVLESGGAAALGSVFSCVGVGAGAGLFASLCMSPAYEVEERRREIERAISRCLSFFIIFSVGLGVS